MSASSPDAAGALYLAHEMYSYPQTRVVISKVTGFGETMEQYLAEGLIVDKGGPHYGVLAALKEDPRCPGDSMPSSRQTPAMMRSMRCSRPFG